MVTPDNETKMIEIPMFCSISCHCQVGTREKGRKLVDLVCGIVWVLLIA